MEDHFRLSARESEVIRLLAKEMSELEIAAYLEIDQVFVRSTISDLMRRTSTKSVVGLMKEAVKCGWIT